MAHLESETDKVLRLVSAACMDTLRKTKAQIKPGDWEMISPEKHNEIVDKLINFQTACTECMMEVQSIPMHLVWQHQKQIKKNV